MSVRGNDIMWYKIAFKSHEDAELFKSVACVETGNVSFAKLHPEPDGLKELQCFLEPLEGTGGYAIDALKALWCLGVKSGSKRFRKELCVSSFERAMDLIDGSSDDSFSLSVWLPRFRKMHGEIGHDIQTDYNLLLEILTSKSFGERKSPFSEQELLSLGSKAMNISYHWISSLDLRMWRRTYWGCEDDVSSTLWDGDTVRFTTPSFLDPLRLGYNLCDYFRWRDSHRFKIPFIIESWAGGDSIKSIEVNYWEARELNLSSMTPREKADYIYDVSNRSTRDLVWLETVDDHRGYYSMLPNYAIQRNKPSNICPVTWYDLAAKGLFDLRQFMRYR